MFRILCSLLLLLSTGIARPQATWSRAYPTPDSLYCCGFAALNEAQNSDLLLITRQAYQSTGNRFARFQRIAADGTPIMQQDWVSTGPGVQWEFHDGAELPDGSVVAVGWFVQHALMMRFDASGTLVAATRFQMGDYSVIRNVRVLNDTTLLLSGEVTENSDQNLFLLHCAPDGTVYGTDRWRIDGHSAVPGCASTCGNGDVVIAGFSADTLNGSNVPSRHLFLARTDSSGTLLWGKRLLVDADNSRVSEVFELPSGDLLLAGSHRMGSDDMPFLLRTDANGEPLWATIAPRVGFSGNGLATRAAALQGANVVFACNQGSFHGTAVIDTNGVVVGAQSLLQADAREAMTTTNGDVVVFMSLDGPLNTPVPVLFRSPDPFGLACNSVLDLQALPMGVAPGGGALPLPITVTTTDLTANFYPQAATITGTFSPCLSTGMQQPETHTLQLWPQPTTDRLDLRTDASIEDVLLLDARGQRCTVPADVNGTVAVLDLRTLASGVYLLRVQVADTWSSALVLKD